MAIEINISPGKSTLPVVVLIHGLGMDRHFWTDPARCFVFGGLAPLTTFLASPPGIGENARLSLGACTTGLEGFAPRLVSKGFTVVSWSQTNSVGPLKNAVEELGQVMDRINVDYPNASVYLVGHSRGGIIARKYLDEGTIPARGLITLATPHHGTAMARFAGYLKPLAAILLPMLPESGRGPVRDAIRRTTLFLASPAIQELLPESELMKSLASPPLNRDMRSLSFGGNNPGLFSLYLRSSKRSSWLRLTFPELLLKALPKAKLPEEAKEGRGDALVTDRSAHLKETNHRSVHLNHVAIAYDHSVQDEIIDFLLADRCQNDHS